MGVVSILGVVPQECKVFDHDAKHKKFEECRIYLLCSRGSIECFRVQVIVIQNDHFLPIGPP